MLRLEDAGQRGTFSEKIRKRKRSIELTCKQRRVCVAFSWEFLTLMEAKRSELKAEARVQVCAGCLCKHSGFRCRCAVHQESGVFRIEQRRDQASTRFLNGAEDHAEVVPSL